MRFDFDKGDGRGRWEVEVRCVVLVVNYGEVGFVLGCIGEVRGKGRDGGVEMKGVLGGGVDRYGKFLGEFEEFFDGEDFVWVYLVVRFELRVSGSEVYILLNLWMVLWNFFCML